MGCSKRYLHILFVRDIGLPPKHWMKLERMVVARRKLEGGKSLEEVCADLGFSSMHTFYRQFQSFYNTTPSRYVTDRQVFDPAKSTENEPTERRHRRVRSSG